MIKKMIVVEDCVSCPLMDGKCKAWKSLTPKQRFSIQVGHGMQNAILKACPLEDIEEQQ